MDYRGVIIEESLGNKDNDAKEYGISIGIPEYQLGFMPEI